MPEADAGRDDPGGRGRLVRRRRRPWTVRWSSASEVDDRDVLWNLGNAALQLGDDAAQQHFYALALSRAREAGAVTAVIYALQRLCFGQYLAGDLVAVRSSAEEALALGRGIGQPAMTAPPIAWLALLAALQGRDEYDDHLARLEEARRGAPARAS